MLEICKECEVYQDRIHIAEAINALYGGYGHWDFQTCYKSCERKFALKREYERVLQKKYYGRRKAMLENT